MLSIWTGLQFCCLAKSYSLPKQALVFPCLQLKYFENIVGKGEIARNEQFLLFLQCFPPFCQNCPQFSSDLKLSSVNSFDMEVSKFCHFGKGKCICKLYRPRSVCADMGQNLSLSLNFLYVYGSFCNIILLVV